MEINGLDLVDIMAAMKRRQNRYIALILHDVEEILGEEQFKLVRKTILDGFNDYTRSIFRILLGDDVEGLVYR